MSRLATIPANPLDVGLIRTYGAGMLVYGLAIIAQGPHRWSGPAYTTITDVASSWKWGAAVATLGLATLVGSLLRSFVLRSLGLYGGALWMCLFGVGALNAALNHPHVSFTLSLLYMIVGSAFCWVAPAREVPRAGLKKNP